MPQLELRDMGYARGADGIQGGVEVQANLTGGVGVRAERDTFATHPGIPFQDERVWHQVLRCFAQTGGIDVQRQVAVNDHAQDAADLVFVTGRVVAEDGFGGADGNVEMSQNIKVSSLEQCLDFGEIGPVNFISGVGAEVSFVEHKVRADEMHRAKNVIEGGAGKNIGGRLRVQVRFGNLDPGADGQFTGEQVTQAFQFGIPGFRLEETRVFLIRANVPVFGEADFRDADLDRAAAHGFQGIVAVFREAGMHVVVKWDHDEPN